MTTIERFARRHPLRAAALAGLALLAGPATLLSRSGGPRPPAEAPVTASRSPAAAGDADDLLAAVRGANPVLCELATRQLGNQWWSMQRGRQEAAMLGLAHTEDPRAVAPLADVLRSGDAELRGGAAWTLGHVGSREALQPLIRAARDDEPRVRRSVARALGRIEDAEAIPTLTQLLSSDGDPTVRRAAAWALGNIE